MSILSSNENNLNSKSELKKKTHFCSHFELTYSTYNHMHIHFYQKIGANHLLQSVNVIQTDFNIRNFNSNSEPYPNFVCVCACVHTHTHTIELMPSLGNKLEMGLPLVRSIYLSACIAPFVSLGLRPPI